MRDKRMSHSHPFLYFKCIKDNYEKEHNDYENILFLVEKSLAQINCLLACLDVRIPLVGRNNKAKIK
jgi:hypothetical protein